MKKMLLSLVILLGFGMSALAAPLAPIDITPNVQQGLKDRKLGRFGEAFLQFRLAARAGDAYGQYWVGYCYLTGQGISRDPVEAAKWFKKSAAQGFAQSEYQLGSCYEYGIGVNLDPAKARQLYQAAAAQGFAVPSDVLKSLATPPPNLYEYPYRSSDRS